MFLSSSDEEPAEEKPAAEAKRDHGTVNLHAVKERAFAECREARQAIWSALQEGSVVNDDGKPPRTSEVEAARGGPCHAARGAHEVLVAAVEDGGVGQKGRAPTPSSHEPQTSHDHNPWSFVKMMGVWEDDDEECWNCLSGGHRALVWHHVNPYADHGARGWPEAWEVAGHGASSSTAAAFDVD